MTTVTVTETEIQVVTVGIAGADAPTITAKNEGTTLTTSMTSIDFVGSGVNATNTAGAVTVTISGGGGGGGLSDGDYGDITVGGGGTTMTIDNGAVTLAKTSAGVQTSLGKADTAVQPAALTSYLTISAAAAAYQPLATVLTNTTASFTTAQETKLAGIESGAQVNTVTASSTTTFTNKSGNISQWTNDSGYITTSAVAAGYQPLATVLTNTTASFTTALETKLNGIEALADVTDTANVTAAGALMDSELTSLSGVKTLTVPDNTTISAFGATLVDDASASAARTTLGLVIGTDVQAYDSDLATIAGLTATTDNFLQAKSSAWTTRTPTQVTADLITMVGDSGSGGTKGLVPAPAAGDAAAGKFLKADGTFAVPSGGGGGSPGGSNKQIQFNNSSAFGGAAGFEYQSGASPNVLLQAQAASHVPFTLRGAASQTANLFEVQNSSSTVRTSISKDGQFVLNGDGGAITIAQLVQLSGTTYWKIGTTIENNASTLQLDATNARINLGGGFVYYDVSGGVARIQTFNELRVLPGALGGTGTRTMSVIAQNAGQIPFAVQGAASQTANLQEWRNSSSTVLSSISAAGKQSFDSTITAGGTTGAQTINKPSGTVNFAAAATSLVVTNSLVTTSSIVIAVVRTNDTTAYIKNVVPGSGSFTINLGAAATAETSVGFIVYN